MARQRKTLAVEIGKRLARARDALKMSQQDVADALGITVEAYGSYERGWHVIPTENLIKVPDVLKMPITHFLGLPDPAGLTGDERMLLQIYRSIRSESIKQFIREMAWSQHEVDRQLQTPQTP